LLAPQRGLIATGEKQKQLQLQKSCLLNLSRHVNCNSGVLLSEFSKFDCLPGRAGGSPYWIRTEKLGEEVTAKNQNQKTRASVG